MGTTILVVPGDRHWTEQALHLAGAMARESAARVMLLMMVPVAHLEYLGAGLREPLLDYAAHESLRDYVATVQSYSVPAEVCLYEYTDYVGGLRSAAEQVGALAVFAPAPEARFQFVARYRLWRLRRGLRQPLHTLKPGEPVTLSVPKLAGDMPLEARPAHSGAGTN